MSPELGETIPEGAGFDVVVVAEQDETVDYIDLYLNNELVRRENITPWDWGVGKGDTSLSGLTPGDHSLQATATTFSGDTLTEILEFTVTPAVLRIAGISLINTDTNIRYTEFDPISNEATVDINLNTLGTNELSLIADVEGDVSSVRFRLDNRFNFRTDNTAPYTITGMSGDIISPWNLEPGEYTVIATPYTARNAGGVQGPRYTVNLRVQQSQLTVENTDISIAENINSGIGAKGHLVLENTGNLTTNYSFSNIPSWLSLSAETGSLNANEKRTLELTAIECTAEGDTQAELTLQSTNTTETIQVTWRCVDGSLFDVALDRFYINQGVPANDSLEGSEGYTVDLIANRKGLARAFVSRNSELISTLPEVRLYYRTAGSETGNYLLSGPSSVPTQTIDEGVLGDTFNHSLPAAFFQLGTEFYIEVDPNNLIDEIREDNNRYPEAGYKALEMLDAPALDIVFVPVIIGNDGEDPALDNDVVQRLMRTSETILPIENYQFVIRDQAFTYTGDSWGDALGMINDIRRAEDSGKHYHGLSAEGIGNSGTSGIAYVPGRAALSRKFSGTIAHEFGHNLSLSHTDCGGPAGPEPDYPHENARTGSWGYDIFQEILKEPTLADFMSYCGPNWIGAFNFRKALNYRGGERFDVPLAKSSGNLKQEWTLLSGTIKENKAEISRVYTVYGRAEDSNTGKEFELELLNENNTVEYHTRFYAESLDHDDQMLFSIAIPSHVLQNVNRLRIFQRNTETTYLTELWKSATASRLMKSRMPAKASRLDSTRVMLQWPADGSTTLWVKDGVTNNILTIDKTGNVVVHTHNNVLLLTYQDKGRSYKETVELNDSP